MNALNIYIETLGCKVNQYESESILDDLIRMGHKETASLSDADIVIINTCSVTNRADYKSRYSIKKACFVKNIQQSRERTIKKIIITGCYSQINKSEISGVDLIVDNNSKHRIVDYIQDNSIINFSDTNAFIDFTEMKITTPCHRGRAILKIQDGCDFDCTYCIVPTVRGAPRSRNYDEIHKQTEVYLQNGYNEIVVAGINIGLYDMGLNDLLNSLVQYSALKQLRLSSLEPQFFTKDLFKTIKKSDKICPHFHIPIQSGSNKLLNLHKRNYDKKHITYVVNRLNSIKAYCAVGFDIMIGLPGETDAFFDETYNFLKETYFTYLHIFIYSKRKGTTAAKMKNQVNEKVVMNTVCETFTSSILRWTGTSDRNVKCYFFDNTLKYKKKELLKLVAKKQYKDGVLCDVIND